MKKALGIICGLLTIVASAQATISLELDAGTLRTQAGATTVPVGGLLQLIASPAGANGVFGAPTATSFVSGDNIVVASFTMNYGFGTGETDNVITFTLQNTGASTPTTFDAGDALLLRWYPTLGAGATAPGFGTSYGQYRNPVGESGGIAWVTPADTTALSTPNGLNFLTTDIAGGTQPVTSGFANFAVVPEPSSMVLIGGAAIGLLGFAKARRRSA